MADRKTDESKEKRPTSNAYFEKVKKDSKAALASEVPSIAVGVIAAVLLWLLGQLIFIPVSQGIQWYGYPLTQILTFILLIAMVIFISKILVDVRDAVDAVAGLAACEIGTPYDVTASEIDHYKTALRGILYIIVVSLAFLLFSDYLALIHPALSGIVLIAIVVWAIFQIWRAVKAVAEEIKRYSSNWIGKTLK